MPDAIIWLIIIVLGLPILANFIVVTGWTFWSAEGWEFLKFWKRDKDPRDD